MKCERVGYPADKLRRELRDMLLEDADAITHALFCTWCETKEVAENALRLADWDTVDFLCALASRSE